MAEFRSSSNIVYNVDMKAMRTRRVFEGELFEVRERVEVLGDVEVIGSSVVDDGNGDIVIDGWDTCVAMPQIFSPRRIRM